ncbi:toll/interleukin-1 receptor domain-containing protein [Candidatus Entotheonella palauensis]|uniref:TIR domain-containing protein n=1 Tax=Candidatus Entotheonella gemina TaxID=1429439 RepID=W4M222_9BACT|nr:toll/interleukin-1 receptor domain-containing protein [Candidatus Entotheonella palauensis]ETX04245.1 MAG: hypothetical protein ETSY2_29910 [Candidatus Entotheonella gemina]
MSIQQDVKYDVFVSYTASEIAFVKTLVLKLADRGLSVWFDQGQLRLGDSVLRSLEDGLEHSNYFLLIISPSFFQGPWTQFEAGVALSRVGKDHILPVYRGIDPDAIKSHAPLLADRVAISADQHSIDEIADMVVEIIQDERESKAELNP